MKFVKDHTSVPIAADESVFTSADAIKVVQAGCADLINIKLMKSGIVEALDIAAIARSANMELMIGCMIESSWDWDVLYIWRPDWAVSDLLTWTRIWNQLRTRLSVARNSQNRFIRSQMKFPELV